MKRNGHSPKPALTKRRFYKKQKGLQTFRLYVSTSVRYQYRHESLVRITGWVRRFIHNKFAKPEENLHGPLSVNEIEIAELLLIKNIQKESLLVEGKDQLSSIAVFKDDWGVLRVKTRLTFRDDPQDFKYPLLLPSTRPEVTQLIWDFHLKYCHAGVGFLCVKLRERYWILKSRRTIKRVLNKCLRCRRFSAKAGVTEPAPLPFDRVKDADVFEVLGVDLAGPMLLKNGNKVWFAIFTCAVYRAVHFELIKSLSTRAFITAFGNFIKKYRRPSIVYSDNGTNFRGTVNLFRGLDWELIKTEVNRIEWKFISVISPWWGGWWERLIRTAKDLMKRTIGKGCLSFKELESVMTSVGDVMNGRPLTYVSENPDDLEPLTPGMFLHPFGNVAFPEGEMTEASRLRYRFNYVKTLQKELRGRFLKEYLALMVNRYGRKPSKAIALGDLVLLGCDNKKRLDWRLGRVLELLPGKDGVVRLAKVKVAGGDCIRTVQRLFPLEMNVQDPVRAEVQSKATTTRSGRKVVVPNRF